MNLVTQIAAGLYAVTLLAVGTLEVFFHADQRFHSIFYIEPGEEKAVRMWAMNVGAYNWTVGVGLVVALFLVNSPATAGAGVGIILFGLASHLFLGPWLGYTERRLWRSSLGQAMLPLIGLVAYLIAH